jgi:hypothetical protein
LLDVYVNGSKLTAAEFTATNGTTFVLTDASVVGNQVQAIRYNASVTGVSGSGTANYVPKFAASQTVGNSSIFDNGNIGIGNTSPDIYGFGSSGKYLTLQSVSGGFSLIQVISDSTSGAGIVFGSTTLRRASIEGTNGANLVFSTTASNSGTSNAERMRITSAGNVGIGTNSPVWMLEINKDTTSGSTGGYPAISVNNPNAAGFTGYYFYNGTTQKGGIEYSNSANAFLIYANSVERMRIASGGDTLFQFAGNRRVGIDYDYTGTYFYGFATNSNARQTRIICAAPDANAGISFETGASFSTVSQKMLITSGGQVSIGTSSTVSTYLLNVKAQTGAQAINITGRDNADGAGVLQWTNQYGTYLGYIEVNSTAMYVARGSGGVYITTNATSWTSNSDSRLKNIISPINNAIDKLSTLNPVIYSWKSDDTNKENIGLIAQDVESVFPQVIDTNKDGFLGVRYTELVPVLVKAIQELSAKIDILENK